MQLAADGKPVVAGISPEIDLKIGSNKSTRRFQMIFCSLQRTLSVLCDVVNAVCHSGKEHGVWHTKHRESIYHVFLIPHANMDILANTGLGQVWSLTYFYSVSF